MHYVNIFAKLVLDNKLSLVDVIEPELVFWIGFALCFGQIVKVLYKLQTFSFIWID